MSTDFDVVVIGSGFGGAVVACRLAEAGSKVVVLERGKRWKREEYPSRSRSNWLWDDSRPEENHGWFDIRFFGNISTIGGAGVGGGSLHYANVSLSASPDLFESGWPSEITFGDLETNYYPKVGAMLGVQKIPEKQRSNRTKLLQDAALKAGFVSELVDLAVKFDNNYIYDAATRPDTDHSKAGLNAEGIVQGTCVHLGQCELGCPVDARNTLAFNYIPRAEKYGAEVRPLHIVWNIEPVQEGYKIHYQEIINGKLIAGQTTARIVVLSAGSIRSTEMLLRCRDKFGTLPRLSPMLGHKWSTNANYLSFAVHPNYDVYPTRGPTITAAIKFLGTDSYKGSHFVIEDGGFPDALADAPFDRAGGDAARFQVGLQFLASQKNQGTPQEPFKNLMPWFAQGRDEPIGRFSLRRQWFFFGPKVLHLSWNQHGARKVLDAIQEIHRKLARVTGSTFIFQLPDALITPHPLGGCPMGSTSNDGVVNHKGEAFGCKNLYIADGSIIPRPIGHNPSKTIAALSERIAAMIVLDGK